MFEELNFFHILSYGEYEAVRNAYCEHQSFNAAFLKQVSASIGQQKAIQVRQLIEDKVQQSRATATATASQQPDSTNTLPLTVPTLSSDDLAIIRAVIRDLKVKREGDPEAFTSLACRQFICVELQAKLGSKDKAIIAIKGALQFAKEKRHIVESWSRRGHLITFVNQFQSTSNCGMRLLAVSTVLGNSDLMRCVALFL